MKGRLTPVRLELAASKIGLASEPNFFDDYIPRVAAGASHDSGPFYGESLMPLPPKVEPIITASTGQTLAE
jgi:hypothetical protein